MGQFTEKQGVGCALAGFYTALAIEKVLPIIHGGPGCVANAQQIMGNQNGSQQGVGFSEGMLPSTNLTDADIVFGGGKKLDELIDNTVQYFDADLYIAIGGCVAAIIGDDMEEITGKYRKTGKPVLFTEAPGFKGNNIWGHTQILKSIIEQYLPDKREKVNKGQVNVWGIVPYYDPFWAGTCDAVEELLKDIGLKPNIIYGKGRGIKNIDKIPEAEFNLVLSPWWDVEIAELLTERYGTPFLHYPSLPIGPTETKRFLKVLEEYANLDPEVVSDYIRKKEDRYYFYIEKGIAHLYDARKLPKRFYTMANSTYALGIAKYFINDLGLVPEKQFITDGVPQKYQKQIAEEYKSFDGGIESDVTFTLDVGSAMIEIGNDEGKYHNATVIVGSSWNDVPAKKLGAYNLHVSAPIGDRVILDRSYFGFDGGLHLFEDLYDKVAGMFGIEMA